MCYQLPGPRCSPHAKKRLEGTRSRIEEKHEKMVDIAKKRKVVQADLQKDPSNKALRKSFNSLTKQGAQYKSQKDSLKEKARLEQIDYDGTPGGQKDLNAELSKLKSTNAPASERMKISTRISKGKSKNFTRKFMLEQKKLAENSGVSTKARRGNFISMSDRSPKNTEVVRDYDLLTTAA